MRKREWKTPMRGIAQIICLLPIVSACFFLSQKITANIYYGGLFGGLFTMYALILVALMFPLYASGIVGAVLLYCPRKQNLLGRLACLLCWAVCVYFFVYTCTAFQFTKLTMIAHNTLGHILNMIAASFLWSNVVRRKKDNPAVVFFYSCLMHVISFLLVYTLLT